MKARNPLENKYRRLDLNTKQNEIVEFGNNINNIISNHTYILN